MSDTEIKLDGMETLISYLLCADGKNVAAAEAGSALLRFDAEMPHLAYTAQLNSGRIFTTDARMLLSSPMDLLGEHQEVAMLSDEGCKWLSFRRLKKAPKNAWVACAGASIYAAHYRLILPTGKVIYRQSVAALDRSGNAVAVVLHGNSIAQKTRALETSTMAILAASLVEDAHRPNTLLATVTDGTAIRLPVPVGEHRELFALREAPLTRAGKRKAIVHWVADHARRTLQSETNVSAHWRGARELVIEGMRVSLAPNGGAA